MPLSLPRPPAAIIFDFDGVILDSAKIKNQAYLTIYADEDPAKLAELLAHEQLHGGVTRRVKLALYEREFFGRSGNEASVDRLARQYADIVYEAVLASPFIAGADAFLRKAHGKIDMHVVSGTPLDELTTIVDERGLAAFFKSVHGAPATKPETFAHILRAGAYAPSQTVAIGDSMTEYWAAEELGIPFFGVVPAGEPNPFPQAVPVASSLASLDRELGL